MKHRNTHVEPEHSNKANATCAIRVPVDVWELIRAEAFRQRKNKAAVAADIIRQHFASRELAKTA